MITGPQLIVYCKYFISILYLVMIQIYLMLTQTYLSVWLLCSSLRPASWLSWPSCVASPPPVEPVSRRPPRAPPGPRSPAGVRRAGRRPCEPTCVGGRGGPLVTLRVGRVVWINKYVRSASMPPQSRWPYLAGGLI